MRRECEQIQTPLVFVYIPTEDWQKFATLQAYMRRTQASLIDMTEANRLPMKGTTLPDGHLNAAGHLYVADALSQWIDQNVPQWNVSAGN